MFRPPTPGWPELTPAVGLPDGARVQLRPLRGSDGADWCETRVVDRQWLAPVEPTVDGTWEDAHSHAAWRNSWLNLKRMAQQGTVVPMVIEVDGAFAGQVTLGNIQHGIVSECWIGYWVDHAFGRVGLHRVTATYLPGNPASGKVLRTNGFVEEGYLRRNLHIDGQWRDHHFVAINIDDYPTTAVQRLRRAGRLV